MKLQKSLHKEMKDGVKNAYRSARSKFNAYFAAAATGTLLVLAPMLPSLANASEKCISVVEQLKEMKISELKKFMNNWKSERGDNKYYNGVTEFKDSFVADVSIIGKNIQLNNGKRLRVGATIYYDNWNKETGTGTGVSNVYVEAMDGLKSVGFWSVPLTQLESTFEQMKGKKLRHIHVIIKHDTNHKKLGEIVGITVVAANSKEEVEKGDIKSKMPGLAFPYVVGENAVYAGEGKPNIITASVEVDGLDGGVVAKK